MPDPRKRRGVRHLLGSVLAQAAAVVAAGAQSFTAIGEWAADAPQQVPARLGARFDPRRDRHIPPDETTIRRVLYDIDGDDLGFPATTQVFQTARHRTDRTTGRRETHTGYGITSLPSDTSPAAIATHLRRHREIENRLRWVRDTTYNEDHSPVRTRTGP